MKYIKTLKIDIDKKNFEVIPSVQYDSNTRFLHIQLLNDSVPFDITGCSVILSGVKEDGNPIFNSCDIINSEIGFIQAEVTEQMNAIPGNIDCEIKIYDGKGVLTSKKFTIKVTASQTSRSVVSSNEFKALTDALNKVQAIDNKAEKAEVEKLSSQLDTKTNKDETKNIQQQVDNLVLEQGNPEASSAEITQARGRHNVLNGRFEENECNFKSITVKEESKNKYNYMADENIVGKYIDYKGDLNAQEKTTVSHFIEVKQGDVVRFIKNPYTSTNYGGLYTTGGNFIINIKASHNLSETDINIDNWTKTLVTFTVPVDLSNVALIKLNLETACDNKYNIVTINEAMPSSFEKYINEYKVNGEKIINQIHENILTRKIAVFNGDSICNGITGIDPSEPTYGWGWAGRIGTRNKMIWKNYGVAGGTVCSDTYNWTWVEPSNIKWDSDTIYYKRKGSSVATGTDTQYQVVTQAEWDGVTGLYTKGNARYWESKNIEKMYEEYPKADYVILEACLNDGFNGVPKGTISSTYTDNFATTTYASAFEYMLQKTKTLFPNAKVGVIIPHRPKGSNTSIAELNNIAKEVCDKWCVPYLDLYNKSGLVVNNPIQKAIMFVDDTHLSVKGYDYIDNMIEIWMKSL